MNIPEKLIEDTSVTRKKYIRKLKADPVDSESEGHKLVASENHAGRLEKYSQRKTLKILGFEMIEDTAREEGEGKILERNLEGEECALGIRGSTQGSLMTMPSFEDQEIARMRMMGEVDGGQMGGVCAGTAQGRSPRYPNIKIGTEFRDLEIEDKEPNSDDSTPHLYIDYKDRLQNILLDYFDE